MSIVKDLQRAYGCGYAMAERMRDHLNSVQYSPTAAAVLGLGPIRVHYSNGWWLDNRRCGQHDLIQAWHYRMDQIKGREFF